MIEGVWATCTCTRTRSVICFMELCVNYGYTEIVLTYCTRVDPLPEIFPYTYMYVYSCTRTVRVVQLYPSYLRTCTTLYEGR